MLVKKLLNDNYLLFSTFQYYVVPYLFFFTIYVTEKTGSPWIAIWIVFTLIPLLDEFFTLDVRNPTPEESKKLENDFVFKVPLYMSLLTDWYSVYYVIYGLLYQDLSFLNQLGYVIVCGLSAASNINVAHELIHKDNFLDKFLGTLTLARNLYTHFAIEHIFGHHRNVGTPKDPASSKQGQTVYEFIPQTLVGSYISAWNLENARVAKRYGGTYNRHNRMIWYTAGYIILPFFMYLLFGISGAVYFIITGFTGVMFLESVNYIEHYGLSRKEVSPGIYEPVNISHSWNAPHRLSNYLLFKLQRHSDHHENPYKPYQILSSYDESPCLPHGYTVCVILAYFPKLWFKIMDSQLEDWKQKKKSIQMQYYEKGTYGPVLRKFLVKNGLVLSILTLLSLIRV